ncbi:ABC transporter substrate-binding protein/permease [Fundicoccus culcitae]|uniref:ABC transporter substrate-binding protein/permease n=1 Tax=Fundicoccus culcitae TaxID=2969821 RepID=A0ABY5P4L2_9LACT|nr:ABC transporter substrate-binding protein/permease [Fundicoccus culcitae]UUX33686.1 ABC transporter substrate-binding protein/permease [Fundicoccus culcitae]
MYFKKRKPMAFLRILFFIGLLFGLSMKTYQSVEAQAEDTPTYTIVTDTSYAPFEFIDGDGELVGIDIELLAAIAADQGFEYEFEMLPFSSALQALESNQADGMIAGMGITEEREASFDFSDPYFTGGSMFAVDARTDIESLEELRGERIAVKIGTTGEIIANELAEEYDFTVTGFEDSVNMYQEVQSGNSTAVIEDFPVMQYAVNTGTVDFRLIGEEMEAIPFGFAVNKGQNADLLAMFNQGLANIQASGEYDAILERYLGENAAIEEVDNSFFGQIRQNWRALASGLWTTIWITLVSFSIALILGIILGLMRSGTSKLLAGIALVYIDIMRGVPLLVLAFFIYFGVPSALGINFTAPVAGILTLSLNAAAYVAENVRGGIAAVNKGQAEASRSLGLSYSTTMRKIILPQAFKIMIPSFINQFVITLKDTSILSVIGLVELTQTGRIIIARTYQSGSMWLIIGLIYIILITILTKISNRLEKGLN